MAEFVDLLTLRRCADLGDACDGLRAAIPAALVAPTLAGGRNAGHILLRCSGVDVPPALPASLVDLIAHRDGAMFEPAWRGGVSPRTGIVRTALFAAIQRPSAGRIAAFEAETIAMPRRIPAIRSWLLGHVLRAHGRFGWTHVWEQTFDSLEALTRDYMHAPCHWGQVDRWFDPEGHDWLIDPGLCHAFAESDGLDRLFPSGA